MRTWDLQSKSQIRNPRSQILLFFVRSRRRGGPWWLAPADAEIVIVQDRVEQQRKAAVRLVPPHRIVGEHHDVALADGNVDDRGFSRKLGTAREHSADKQFLSRSRNRKTTRGRISSGGICTGSGVGVGQREYRGLRP